MSQATQDCQQILKEVDEAAQYRTKPKRKLTFGEQILSSIINIVICGSVFLVGWLSGGAVSGYIYLGIFFIMGIIGYLDKRRYKA